MEKRLLLSRGDSEQGVLEGVLSGVLEVVVRRCGGVSSGCQNDVYQGVI